MAFDYKKEYKTLYQPATKPTVEVVPPMNFVAVRGKGNPNEENGEYKRGIELLYGIAYTIKMSKKGDRCIEGYFDYVVPPLEGLWWTEDGESVYADKSKLCFISMIRLPDFVEREDFDWAFAEATRKKKADFSQVEFFTYNEGSCVQCMHIGSYDDEPAAIAAMQAYAEAQGYAVDLNNNRRHHEIYLSDPRKTAPDKCKTIIRLPIIKNA
ncbi:MAG: GyrI-like domain-containing protein [Bacteroidales bacterium]|nr:GyrI-like domain-containing protein [Bacteroidales bacterium]